MLPFYFNYKRIKFVIFSNELIFFESFKCYYRTQVNFGIRINAWDNEEHSYNKLEKVLYLIELNRIKILKSNNNLPGPRAPPGSIRPNLNITALSYSCTTFSFQN